MDTYKEQNSTTDHTQPAKTPRKWQIPYWIGIGAIGVSLLIYFLDSQVVNERSGRTDQGELFVINYVMAIVYGIYLMVWNFRDHKFRFWKLDGNLFNLMMILYFISCWSLNLLIPIFAILENWAAAALFFALTPLVLTPWMNKFSSTLRIINFFLLGFCTIFMLYFMVYLGPWMIIGIVGAFILGLTAHLLVPLILFVRSIRQYFVSRRKHIRYELYAYLAGIILPFSFLTLFVAKYYHANTMAQNIYDKLNEQPASERIYPVWVMFSQQLPDDGFVNSMVKGSVFYQNTQHWGDLDHFGSNSNRKKHHNPLISVSELVTSPVNIGYQERQQIMRSRYDIRHDSHRKLWSDWNLSTRNVMTDIKVYDDFGIAYVEKTIKIKNESHWENDQEEALYSFYMPEGSIVTSLSLWINGVEEKARLTTRQKADSAYVAVVGRERRDPALLHWQEGNRVTVTVFPCTPKEERVFKVGFTIPLEQQEGKYILKNVFFDGPDWDKTRESTYVTFASGNVPSDLEFPGGFKRVLPDTEKDPQVRYQRKGTYKNYWEISFDAQPLSDKPFVFNGNAYQLTTLQTSAMKLDPEAVYLDINKYWTKSQVLEILRLFKDKKVYAYDEELFEIQNGNNRQIDKLLSYHFSLFPFHLVKNPSKSLVISASGGWTPNLDDLKNTLLIKRLATDLDRDQPIPLYHIGPNPCDYIRSLKEFEAFHYSSGTFANLKKSIQSKKMDVFVRNESVVSYENAGFSIRKTALTNNTAKPASAPDHLMRLFGYKQVMSQIGLDYFNLESLDPDKRDLNKTAEEAFIVTPVSTLIVLESVVDYDRFDIPENQSGLKNASMSGSGAVPEPHEWLLIFLVTAIALYFYRRKVMQWLHLVRKSLNLF